MPKLVSPCLWLCAGNLLQTLTDNEIAAFYIGYHGSEALWSSVYRREYKVRDASCAAGHEALGVLPNFSLFGLSMALCQIVASTNTAWAKKCGFFTSDAMWLTTLGPEDAVG